MTGSFLSDTYCAESIPSVLARNSGRLLLMLMRYIASTRENYFILTLKNEVVDEVSTQPSWLIAEISNGDTFCFGYSAADEFVAQPHLWVSFKLPWKHEAITILHDGIKAMERQANAIHYLLYQIPPMPRRLPPQEGQEGQ